MTPEPPFLIYADSFLAGVFTKPTVLAAYLMSMPPGGCVVRRVALRFPFCIHEPFMGVFHEYQTEAEVPAVGTVYTIDGPYQPPIPWTDHMGGLDHRHFDEDARDN